MIKVAHENQTYTQKLEKKLRRDTIITLEENDSFDDVKEEIKNFLGPDGVIRAHCPRRPMVYRTINSIYIVLRWYPEHEFQRTYTLEIETNDQELLTLLYDQANICIDDWFNMENKIGQKK